MSIVTFPLLAPSSRLPLALEPSPTVAFRNTMADARRTARGVVQHQGIDMMVPRGQLVVAASPGTVTGARWDGTGLGGWCVVIDGKGVSSKRTYRFLYAHLMLPPFVKAGAHVEAGSLLGVSGDTGGLHKAEGARFTGAHLHFSCATEGSYIDMTAQMAELVRALKPGVYALPKDEDGAITSAALQSIAVAADAAPDWYIKQLATAER